MTKNKTLATAILATALYSQALANPAATNSAKPQTSATWQQLLLAGRQDKAKSAQYSQAALDALSKTLKENPGMALSRTDRIRADVLCVHMMCVDGSKILDGQDGSKMQDKNEVEKLIQEQTQDFIAMKDAHAVLKKISPTKADQLAWELTKCSTFMAATKANLGKLQQRQPAH